MACGFFSLFQMPAAERATAVLGSAPYTEDA